MLRLLLASALALALLLVGAASASAAPRKVPFGFVGMGVDRSLTAAGPLYLRPSEFRLMAESGVETIRTAFYWGGAQPYAREQDVPLDQRQRFEESVAGVPTDYTPTDEVMAAAAARGIRTVPTILLSPAWAARYPGRFGSPPKKPGHYANFVRAMVRRYGPGGSFWGERPDLAYVPIRDWQIWNEPALDYYWSDQPFARGYVRLLKRAYSAVKQADPSARVVLAGLHNRSWKALDKIYRAGGRGAFDVVAIHPFTYKPENVIRILRLARNVMKKNGDSRLPLTVTELSWPSASRAKTGFGRGITERRQAQLLSQAYVLLERARRELRLTSVFWYTWLSAHRPNADSFDFAGLRRSRKSGAVRSKPALAEFRRAARRLEGCAKSHNAARCR